VRGVEYGVGKNNIAREEKLEKNNIWLVLKDREDVSGGEREGLGTKFLYKGKKGKRDLTQSPDEGSNRKE